MRSIHRLPGVCTTLVSENLFYQAGTTLIIYLPEIVYVIVSDQVSWFPIRLLCYAIAPFLCSLILAKAPFRTRSLGMKEWLLQYQSNKNLADVTPFTAFSKASCKSCRKMHTTHSCS